MTFSQAIDLYLGHLARQGRLPATLRSYRRLLNDFADSARDCPVEELRLEHYEAFLDRWVGKKSSTLASGVSLVRGFSKFLHEREYAATFVADPLKRPRRPKAEDLEVVSISGDDVAKMLDACETWQELICIASAAYTGARRSALSNARLADVDFETKTVRFSEKGGKVIEKPLANEYLAILQAARAQGVWDTEEEYLIPNKRAASVKRAHARSDKIVWETIKGVAARAGIKSHVHAFRAAFAVTFDEMHPGHVIDLKELLGHERIETTMIYLRRKDRKQAMESVRDLSFGSSVFPPEALGAHTGFEPVSESEALPEPLRLKLTALRTAAKAQCT